MKKILSFIFALFVVLVLVGCAKTYSVSFDTDGGNEIPTIEYKSNEGFELPSNPEKLGHTFAGWYFDEAFKYSYDHAKFSEKDFDMTTVGLTKNDLKALTLYAKWDVNSYTITFDSDGGSEVASVTYKFGEKITAPANPTKKGYGFDAWYVGTTKFIFDTMPAENVNLKANWNIGKFQISFDSKGGTAVEAISANYGEAVTAPANPNKTGYIFDGWYLGDTKYEFTTMPAEDVTLTAKWTAEVYDVNFISQDLNYNEQKDEDPFYPFLS